MKQPKPDYTLHQLRQGAKEIRARDAEIKNLRATIDRYAKHSVNYVVEQPKYNNTLRFAMISDTHLESLSGGTKPNILGMGHYHKSEHLPCYRNVEGLQAGCFQAQTPLMKRKHSSAHLGGWIMTVTVGLPAQLSNRFNSEFIAFYEKDPEHVTA